MEKQTTGGALVAKLEAWLSSWMAFPDSSFALVAALWAIHTYLYKSYDATPYLVINAATKGSGKTAFLELVASLCHNAEVLIDPTPSVSYRMLDMYDGEMTFAIDEAEKLAAENNPFRPFVNGGYRQGSTLPRTMPGGKPVKFPIFCPKAFALIGDVYDTMRDRAIVLTLVKSDSVPRKYRRSEAQREAAILHSEIKRFIGGLGGADLSLVECDWLNGRDEEIWQTLLSVARVVGVDKATYQRVVRASADLTAAKTAEAKTYRQMAGVEDSSMLDHYATRAASDLLSIFRPGEKKVGSADAVARMKEIAYGPWRTFRGKGLDQYALSDLVGRFGIHSGQSKIAGRNVQGFSRASVEASVTKK